MSATALPLPKVEHCMALVPFGPGMCDIHSIQPEQGIVTHLTIDDILQVTLHNAYIEQLGSSVYNIELYMILSYLL